MRKLSGLFFCFPRFCCRPRTSEGSAAVPLLDRRDPSERLSAHDGSAHEEPHFGEGVGASRIIFEGEDLGYTAADPRVKSRFVPGCSTQ